MFNLQVTMASGYNQQEGSLSAASNVSHVITGKWDPSETAFAVLNQETPSDVAAVYMTVAADLVMAQVRINSD